MSFESERVLTAIEYISR